MRAGSGYTPQEAAALVGVRLRKLQNAITERRLGRSFRLRQGRRQIDLPAVLTFAVLHRLRAVRIDPAALYRAFSEAGGMPSAPLAVDDGVALDATRLLAPVARNLHLYETARERIVRDPDIMGGLPTVKGTRLPARTLHARIKGGDTIGSILEDYPYLDEETIEAAVLYVEANPERGRPRSAKQAGADEAA